MPQTSKGLYAPRLADLTFAIIGTGSLAILGFGAERPDLPMLEGEFQARAGHWLLAFVVAAGIATALSHRFDRQRWDDYMRQVVAQSALIGMVTFIIAAALAEVTAFHLFGVPISRPMTLGAIPMAGLAWSIGYAFLRWRGTGE
ncbi:hypothetical protein [Parerythrobacter aestuarii]|uniref:hypothetical protein n=1 Tax=Parerythrobacter aestuarii TaxID=3020909 RepID=UPI0024DEF0AE|nr:hypothetical protein [Parerythrobacter aestuarii]